MTAAALACLSGSVLPALADSSSVYRQAVEAAYNDIRLASNNDSGPATRALSDLEAGVGQSQPEIAGDLSQRPPDYADAQSRLLSLLAALDQPATTADPGLAHQRLQGVLSMSRYDALHRPPSPIERLGQWLHDRLGELLSYLQGRGVPPIPLAYVAALGALILAVVAALIFRSTRGGLGQALTAAVGAGPRPPADYFAEADRLALAGDRVGAIRALCAGVAGTLSGERTWEGSPLTVREIFQGSHDAERLRPLLLPFEAAVYGGRRRSASCEP